MTKSRFRRLLIFRPKPVLFLFNIFEAFYDAFSLYFDLFRFYKKFSIIAKTDYEKILLPPSSQKLKT